MSMPFQVTDRIDQDRSFVRNNLADIEMFSKEDFFEIVLVLVGGFGNGECVDAAARSTDTAGFPAVRFYAYE